LRTARRQQHTAHMPGPGDAKATIPITMYELKIASLAKTFDLHHEVNPLRNRAWVLFFLDMALKIKSGKYANRHKH